jgi:hypothetical protein
MNTNQVIIYVVIIAVVIVTVVVVLVVAQSGVASDYEVSLNGLDQRQRVNLDWTAAPLAQPRTRRVPLEVALKQRKN